MEIKMAPTDWQGPLYLGIKKGCRNGSQIILAGISKFPTRLCRHLLGRI